MLIVPQAFISSANIKNVLVEGTNGVFLKEVRTVNPDEERYLSAHALTLVLRGQLNVSPADGRRQLVKENQMIFLPKGLYMISDVIPEKTSFKAIVFFFTEDVIDDFLKDNKHDASIDTDFNRTNVFHYTSELSTYVDGLISLYGQHHNNHQMTRFKLLELLNLISRSAEGQKLISVIQSFKNKSKGNVKSFMEKNFDRGLNIEDYAYLTGRSLSTFHRDFKRQFGVAPKKWLISKRMEKAKSLLKSDDISVTQLALESGYENVSHFIKAFRREFGISPKQFQIRRREKALS